VTDPSRYDDTGGAPRWVKAVGIIALVVALLVVVMVLIGGTGGHGPQRHGGTGGAGAATLCHHPARDCQAQVPYRTGR
jgi:hypothetical protein